MDTDSPTKFSLAFFLAILFHLLLAALMILEMNFNPNITTEQAIEAIQATILDAEQISSLQQKTNPPEVDKGTKKLSRLEKKRLERIKRQALRLEQAEKGKLLAIAAQRLVVSAIQAKKIEQEKVLLPEKTAARPTQKAQVIETASVPQTEKIAAKVLPEAQNLVVQKESLKKTVQAAEMPFKKAEESQSHDLEKQRLKYTELKQRETLGLQAKENRAKANKPQKQLHKQKTLHLADKAEKKNAALAAELALEKLEENQAKQIKPHKPIHKQKALPVLEDRKRAALIEELALEKIE